MAGQGKPGAAAAASLDNHTSQQKTQLKLEGGDQPSEAHPQKPTPPQPSQTVSPAGDPMFKHRNLNPQHLAMVTRSNYKKQTGSPFK